jgi:hypothetical protein
VGREEEELLTNVCLLPGAVNFLEEDEGELANVCQVEDEEGVYLMEPPNTEIMVSRISRMIKMMRASFIRVS